MKDNIDEIDLISLKIIEKNTLSKSMREANERKEDLARVLHRVENIYGEFEKPLNITREFSTFYFGNKKNSNSANIEMVEDVPTLEQMLVSHQSREKYLQQVTVFIVGYSKVAQDRLRLMQEVNQFFLSTEDLFDSNFARENKLFNNDTDDYVIGKTDAETMALEDDEPDYSVSELSESMQQSIDTCHSLTNRLGELNNEMIECFAKYAQNKAGNKGKKKLEKSLENAVSETAKLTEKLAQTNKIISEKDSRIDSLLKQCEAKSKEVQKFKAAADSIRNAALESDSLRQQIKDRDARLMKLESELIQTQMKIEEVKTVDAAQRANAEDMAKEYHDKSMHLEKTLDLQRIEFEETKREMTRQHSAQLKQLQAQLEERITQAQTMHEQETKQLKSSEFDENAVAIHWSESDNELEKPLTKSLSSISKNEKDVIQERKSPMSKSPSRIDSGNDKIESRQRTNIGSGRSSGKDVWTFDDAPDLDDEDFWLNIPRNHLIGRFAQYRQMSRVARSGLQDDIEAANHTTGRQIHSLKSQHQALKHKWDEERENLIEALRKVEEERKETQIYADSALQEMEKFLSFMKSDEEVPKSSDIDLSHLNMLEIAEFIRDYLKKNNLLIGSVSSMIETLISKCQIFQERTKISLPRFPTMIMNNKDRYPRQELTEKNSQTESTSKVVDSYGFLDEERDILLPYENDDTENKTRDVAVSASPTLLKFALRAYKYTSTEIEAEGVTDKDLELPSSYVDIEDITGLALIQHPIVVDYLHSYDHILTFKEHFVTLMEDFEKADPYDIVQLRELKPISIRSQNKIIPQIEEIGKSIEQILFISGELVEKIMFPRKKPSKQSKPKLEDNPSSLSYGKQTVNTKSKANSVAYLNFLNGECSQMKLQLRSIKQSFILKFNGINNAMTKIGHLMNVLVKQNNKLQTEEIDDVEPNHESENIEKPLLNQSHNVNYDTLSILFTRKDSERNIRRMQEAMLQNKIENTIYEEAVEKMADYVDIPAKRLLVLVKKYMYRSAMQKIAEYVKRHNQFDADTFKILDKMEDVNEKRIRRYDQIQDYFRNERILRAQAMIETFDKMQNHSSIFLIRPVLSKSSRHVLDQMIQSTDIVQETQRLRKAYLVNARATKIPNGHISLSFKSKALNVDISQSNEKMWMPNFEMDEETYNPNALIESKLFEIDTNRMLLPLNNVSMNYAGMYINDGQPSLPPNIAVRSYVAVAHPTLVDINISPRYTSNSNMKMTAPDSASRSRLSKDLSKHAPLPPITPAQTNIDMIAINDDLADYMD